MIYKIDHPKAGLTKVDYTMALNMFKTKSYPTIKSLIEFGKSVCMVKNSEKVIEKIQTFKEETLIDCRSRIDPWLFENLKSVWSGREPI